MFFRTALYVLALSYSVNIQGAILSPKVQSRQDPGTNTVTLEEILSSTFSSSGFGGSWAPGSDTKIRVTSGNNVSQYSVLDDGSNNDTIVTEEDFKERFEGQGLGLTFSADDKFILIEHSRRSLWRHSYLAKYDVYEIATRKFVQLQPNDVPITPQEELQLVVWSPTGNSLAFVYRNNIYYKKGPLETDVVQKITDDGGKKIFNGISDWVYEEEMFGSPVAMWFSKNSSNLAYVRFDDTLVEEFAWPIYGEPGNRDTVYPAYTPLKYPKAGRENPIVSVYIKNLLEVEPPKKIVYPPTQQPTLQYYIATANWASDTGLIVENLNRNQTISTWQLCTTPAASCIEIYSYTQSNGWIDAHTPVISDDGSKFLTLQPVIQSSDPNGRSYTHIVSVSTTPSEDTSRFTPITSGVINVDAILRWDEPNGKIYFSATGVHNNTASDPSERHVYSVASTGSNNVPECISCALKSNAEENCRSNSITFSANFTYYIHSCRGPGIPETSIKQTSNNERVKMLVDNANLRAKLEKKNLPTTEEFEVPVEGGFIAKVRLYLPPNLDRTKKYPLFIDVYAGPDSQKLTQDYKVDWGTYLASSRNIIYASIDGRGSGRQSAELKFAVNRNLGSAEIIDQISVTKHLVESLPYIDANRTAIWGWSYGGYATAMALGKDSENVFKCGISVAPVTSWLYYDTIYTERYMGTPSDLDNWNNYNSSSVMNNIENIRSKQFLLIHGNADDNVHYQQSMMLARALEKADIMFSQLSYPEENHGISGPGMRRHLYHSIERFLDHECAFASEAKTNDDNNNSSSSFTPKFYSILIAITVFLSSINNF